jgi:uncharacterized protein (TIGR03066 family)
MRVLGYALTFCALLFLGLAGSAPPKDESQEGKGTSGGKSEPPADKKEKAKSSNAEKIVGSWEFTRGEMSAGSVVEFTREGKFKMTGTLEGKVITVEGSYKVEGDKITITRREGSKEATETGTIKTLNETTLITRDEQGKIDEFKKKGVALPPLPKVKGKVTVDGKLITSGHVTLIPLETEKAKKPFPFSIGQIDSSGNYEIFTDGRSGAPLGKYRVKITPKMVPEKGAKGPPRFPYHPNYTDPAKTPLHLEVAEKSLPGAYDLKLKSK